jgi:D-alanyl-D-alanine carboxypeptidase/D-alanyl-D-alanine-endopeptidase (penicillin-binding protein 4)
MEKFSFVARFFPVVLLAGSLWTADLKAQAAKSKLQKAYQQFQSDPQLKHATSSLYVINAKTGQVVFDKNSQVGLAPASTQKVITATTAFELLGKDYRYKTIFAGDEKQIIVRGCYDPTFGSWRYEKTKDTAIFNFIVKELQSRGITGIQKVIVYKPDIELPPGGWINEDIGNYYGAAAYLLNWKENQYDLNFIPGNHVGDFASIDTSLYFDSLEMINACKTGPPGSGDNAYISFVPGTSYRIVQGTVPAGVRIFSISGADPLPGKTFTLACQNYLANSKLFIGEKDNFISASPSTIEPILKDNFLFSYQSPSLDSIVYWFLQRSINLYGEALLKTFAYEKRKSGSTDTGVAIIKSFWKGRGLDPDELNIKDGSGLSPQNRVTTHAQVEVLKYAAKQSWFPYFFAALPEINHMKIKSGTISDVKGFCGYHTAGDGTQYIFSFLVNNYNGSTSAVVQKMYKVLDVLK